MHCEQLGYHGDRDLIFQMVVNLLDNAIKYFVDTFQWAESDDIDIFYFSSFDESWKVDAEGDVGAYWGLWDKDGQLKYG